MGSRTNLRSGRRPSFHKGISFNSSKLYRRIRVHGRRCQTRTKFNSLTVRTDWSNSPTHFSARRGSSHASGSTGSYRNRTLRSHSRQWRKRGRPALDAGGYTCPHLGTGSLDGASEGFLTTTISCCPRTAAPSCSRPLLRALELRHGNGVYGLKIGCKYGWDGEGVGEECRLWLESSCVGRKKGGGNACIVGRNGGVVKGACALSIQRMCRAGCMGLDASKDVIDRGGIEGARVLGLESSYIRLDAGRRCVYRWTIRWMYREGQRWRDCTCT